MSTGVRMVVFRWRRFALTVFIAAIARAAIAVIALFWRLNTPIAADRWCGHRSGDMKDVCPGSSIGEMTHSNPIKSRPKLMFDQAVEVFAAVVILSELIAINWEKMAEGVGVARGIDSIPARLKDHHLKEILISAAF